ncbi:hypothetical protein UFOVP148_62 [uncultured Caudovirales phage]|uniref:Putative tail fiber protein gp53-like C-terminal domain-containing protein n=1 Tax=uncultured Caudovirales phage TaxID=2100421 RepID=A0A6J7W8P5_9CAUD|nr:hypothetical protein UFOVP148_62 [uncultured Caudovirales phage]
MQSSNIPSKIPLPFANAAGPSYVNTIPVTSQIGITNGRASLADGFPPLTFTPIASGGVPPFGADMNGILKEITSIQQWQQAGGFFPYDSAFSTTVGGYPKGAILQSANLQGLWVSTAENNTTNPDTGGAGWVSLSFEGLQAVTVTSADVTLTQLQSAYPVLVISGAKTAARNLIFPAIVGEWIVQNNTTGAYTLTAKTASGTGVTLTQGESTYIYGDGTNIYFADSSKVASFNGRVGTVTLTALDVTNALGYIPVNPTDFVQSSTTNGYQKLPSGIIVQWGRFNTPPSGNPWPYGFLPMNITFPNAMFSITGNADSLPNGGGMNNPAGSNLATVCFENLGTTGCNYRMDTNQGTVFSGTCPISWIAIGY